MKKLEFRLKSESPEYLIFYFMQICMQLGETGRISVTGAISVSDVFFFLKIIVLLAQKNLLVHLMANIVGQ